MTFSWCGEKHQTEKTIILLLRSYMSWSTFVEEVLPNCTSVFACSFGNVPALSLKCLSSHRVSFCDLTWILLGSQTWQEDSMSCFYIAFCLKERPLALRAVDCGSTRLASEKCEAKLYLTCRLLLIQWSCEWTSWMKCVRMFLLININLKSTYTYMVVCFYLFATIR